MTERRRTAGWAEVVEATRAAIDRLRGRLQANGAPVLEANFVEWLGKLAGGRSAERYFTHPDAFPMLLLPWWFEEALMDGRVDRRFQGELAYASVCGYLFVRLVDDSMDGAGPPAEVLPALLVLHAEFQHTYQRQFASVDPFWDSYFAVSYEAAETAAADRSAPLIGRDEFAAISSRKVAGAKIPLAAVAYRRGRLDELDRWCGLVDALGRWHQMRNDVLDWRRDHERGTPTYFLGEAARRTAGQGSVTGWVLTEGIAWAQAELAESMTELRRVAASLGSPPLVAYLGDRQRRDAARWRALRESAAALAQLSARLSASQRSASASDQPLRRA